MLASSLKAKVRQNQLTLGPLLTMDFWPGYLEIFKSEGMDFVILDMEHGSASLRQAEELCRTARLLELPLLIRPEATLYHLLRKYLDMGPAGFMLPWTERQDQIDALLDAVFLESPAGIKQLASLVAHDWIDATMLGPYDLSLNLGRWAQTDHPEVVAAIDQVRTESLKLNKPCGMVIGTVEQAKFWVHRGFNFFICSEVSVMVRHQAQSLIQGIRSLREGA